MAAVIICSDFGAPPKKSLSPFPLFSHLFPTKWWDHAMISVFWLLSFKPAFSLHSFTFTKRLLGVIYCFFILRVIFSIVYFLLLILVKFWPLLRQIVFFYSGLPPSVIPFMCAIQSETAPQFWGDSILFFNFFYLHYCLKNFY